MHLLLEFTSSEGEPYGPFVLAQISDSTPQPELASISPPIPTPVTRPEPEPTRPVVVNPVTIASVSPPVDGGGELARQKAIAAELLAEDARKQQEKEAKEFAEAQAVKQKEKTVRQAADEVEARYRNNDDGTVTDVKTSLMWKRCAEGQSGSDCRVGDAKKYKWEDAIKNFGIGVGFASYDDWRLPTIEELRTLVYCSNGMTQKDAWNQGCYGRSRNMGEYQRPTINQKVFPNIAYKLPLAFWSASPYTHSHYAWFVDFDSGEEDHTIKGEHFQVRLVRSGQ